MRGRRGCRPRIVERGGGDRPSLLELVLSRSLRAAQQPGGGRRRKGECAKGGKSQPAAFVEPLERERSDSGDDERREAEDPSRASQCVIARHREDCSLRDERDRQQDE